MTDIYDTCQTDYKIYNSHGDTPNIHMLDGECSKQMKTMFVKNSVAYQLRSPHIHRRNAVEQAIRTYKNHLLAGLATCDPEFPIDEWDRNFFQCKLTLGPVCN